MSGKLLFPLMGYVEETMEAASIVEDEKTYELLMVEMEEEMVEEEPAEVSNQLLLEKLKDYNYLRSNFYTVDPTTTIGEDQLNLEDLMKYNVKLNPETEGPKVLIYHTHSQEGFVDSKETIVDMGKYLAQLLNEKGIETMHHNGVYDLQDGQLDRSRAYQLAENKIQEILNQNPSIEVVIDLHRDGIDGNKRLVTDMDGKKTAKIMYFNGLSRTKQNGDIDYLYNPYIDENLSFSFQMQLATETMYPGVARKIYLKGYRYSLHLLPKSLLIEVGAQTNTVEEMKNAMDVLANVLEEVLL